MIGKVTKGVRVGDIAAYLHGPGNHNEHRYNNQPGGAVIASSNPGLQGDTDGHEWARKFRHSIARAGRTVRDPVWQCSLSAAVEDPVMSDWTWHDIALSFAELMGFTTQPWVAIRHGQDHIHFVATRVDLLGATWSDGHDWARVQDALRQIEDDYGLTKVKSSLSMQHRERTQTLSASKTQNELKREQATGVQPTRTIIAERLQQALEHRTNSGREAFEKACADLGVVARANVSKTGRVSGYAFALEGEEAFYAASKIARGYSWKNLEKLINTPPAKPAEPNYAKRDEIYKQVHDLTGQDLATLSGSAIDQAREQWVNAQTKRERQAYEQLRTRWAQAREQAKLETIRDLCAGLGHHDSAQGKDYATQIARQLDYDLDYRDVSEAVEGIDGAIKGAFASKRAQREFVRRSQTRSVNQRYKSFLDNENTVSDQEIEQARENLATQEQAKRAQWETHVTNTPKPLTEDEKHVRDFWKKMHPQAPNLSKPDHPAKPVVQAPKPQHANTYHPKR